MYLMSIYDAEHSDHQIQVFPIPNENHFAKSNTHQDYLQYPGTYSYKSWVSINRVAYLHVPILKYTPSLFLIYRWLKASTAKLIFPYKYKFSLTMDKVHTYYYNIISPDWFNRAY